ALPAKHPLDFAVRHRRWRLVQAAAHEIPDAGRLTEQVEDPVVVLDLHHWITRIELPLANHPLAVSHFRHAFDGNDDLAELSVQSFNLDTPLDRVLDRFLSPALDFHDVPSLVACRLRLPVTWLAVAGLVGRGICRRALFSLILTFSLVRHKVLAFARTFVS